MIVFSNCKINLGLRILRKRADGYHDLETAFYPLRFHDVIEAIRINEGDAVSNNQAVDTANNEADIQFTSSGIEIGAATQQNLCMKAYSLLSQSYDIPPLQLHLHKAIPSGAGLGGGSANAAFTLKLLNTKFNLGLSTERLLDLALQLGSDCPFFIVNKPCLATGRGEIMEKIDLSQLDKFYIAVINPGIHVSTAWAFSKITPGANTASIKEVLKQPVSTWKNELINDFEQVVCEAHPQIAAIKQMMYKHGAVYSAMSGSGSSVFGLFETMPEVSGEFGLVKIVTPEEL